MKRLVASLLLLSASACVTQSVAVPEQPVAAQAMTLEGVENLHRVNDVLYRSAQPTPQGFSNLYAKGVRSVLNLREYHRDTRKARHTNLHLMAYPVAAGEVTEADIENCLRLIAGAPKPVLVHCWHGSDRTGIIVAAYRIIYENWSVAQAEAEFCRDEYGHHEFWYRNLVRLLRSTDWAAMKARLTR